MSTTTTNYGLTKPATTDVASIAQLNTNADIIDTALHAHAVTLGLNTTQGLYARTHPLPDGGAAFRPLAVDPNQTGVNGTGRLWGIGSQFSQIGYSDDDGATFVAKGTLPDAPTAVSQMTFSANWLWIATTVVATSASGNVWRVALPNVRGNPGGAGTDAAGNQWGTTIGAASNGASLPQATITLNNPNYFATSGQVTIVSSNGPQLITYTGKSGYNLTGCTGGTGTVTTASKVFVMLRVFGLSDLVNGPAGSPGAGGANSDFRNSCFAINTAETHAYVCEYGGTNSTVALPAWTDGVMAAGSSLVYSAAGTAPACATLNGLTVTVAGAGAGGADLTSAVVSVQKQSGSACLVLANPALTAVTAATVTFPSTTYGTGTVVGGPSVYHSANPGATATSVLWSKALTLPGAKHLHAVKVINDLPWLAAGDNGGGFPDAGVWVATSLAATNWIKRSYDPVSTWGKGPINFFPVTVSGQQIVLFESDTTLNNGPLAFQDATGTKLRALMPTCFLPAPYAQTMRQLTVLSNGNIMWVGTCEALAAGLTTCIWLSRQPYTTPVLLEDVGQTIELEALGDSVISNGYVWFGTYRCVQEKFLGQ